MTTLYFDCFSGASGDMILGALLDAGAPEEHVRSALESLRVDGWKLEISVVTRAGLRATRAEVLTTEDTHERTYRDVIDVVNGGALDERVRRRALDVFERLARAEGRVHGIASDDVVFHEVGSVDAIVDVVAACAAFEHFAPDHVVTSPIATGTGTVQSRHGMLPLPAPAVVELLRGRGATLVGRGEHELLTPTGAALLSAFTDTFGALPALRVAASGYGAGAADLTHANTLRVLIGNGDDELRRAAVLITTNIDDMRPELVPDLLEALLATGAQDAWVTPAIMKKGRPALTLSVLADAARLESLIDVVYRETTTLGLRVARLDKHELARDVVEVDVEGEPVRVKLGMRAGAVVTVAPEHDDARAAADATGIALKDVYRRAEQAARAALDSER